MLRKKEFNNLMTVFQKEFNDKLGEAREELLYKKVSVMTYKEFSETLIETISRYNRDQLPCVKVITSIACQVSPNIQPEPIKLNLNLVNR